MWHPKLPIESSCRCLGARDSIVSVGRIDGFLVFILAMALPFCPPSLADITSVSKEQPRVQTEPQDKRIQANTKTPTKLRDFSKNNDRDSKRNLSSKRLPKEVTVLPIFFVPQGELEPSQEQISSLMRHLEWTRTRYLELMHNKDSFAIADAKQKIYLSKHPLAFYRELPENAAPQFVSELLADLKYNRYTCPYILLFVVMNPHDGFPGGGGRPLNGGFNTGGGVVILSSSGLDSSRNFQSTLQHELGHSFGLVHVDCYEYDMTKCNSIMSYNPMHHTDGFTPSRTPGVFLPEDLRGLASNTRAFPKFRYDPKRDVPRGYSLKGIFGLGPMTIPGQEEYEPSR